MKDSLIYFGCAVICFVIALICMRKYLKYKIRKDENWSPYLGEVICICIVIAITIVMVLLYLFFPNNRWVSSGLMTIILMLISKVIFYLLSKKIGCLNGNCIAVSYIFALTLNIIVCLFYYESIDLALTCLAVLLGRFIWFDNYEIDTFSKIFNRVKSILIECRGIALIQIVIEGVLILCLVLEKNVQSFNVKNAVNGCCTGMFLGAVALMIEALLLIKKEKRKK